MTSQSGNLVSPDESGFISTIPERYKNSTLENCLKIPPFIVELGYKWASDFPLQNLFICGTYGCGKTWLAFALLREAIRSHKELGYFWPRHLTSRELDAKLLIASKSENGDLQALIDWGQEDLLLIDDLGRETKSERLKNQYFEIFNRRYNDRKPTIITSNFNLNELGDILDGSIISRLQDCKVINLPKHDLRKGTNN
jgi:DNA replication protein DnaC